MSRTRATVLALALALGLLTGCTAAGDDGEPVPAAAEEVPLAEVETTMQPCPEQTGTPASGAALPPDLVLECIGGGSLDLGLAPGVPTVVNFWGSWCGPCREELPLVQQLADAGGDQLRVLGLVILDGVPQATSFAEDAGVTIPGAYDRAGAVMAELGQRSAPVTLFLDADGAIAFTKVGPVTSLAEFEQLVGEHLGVPL